MRTIIEPVIWCRFQSLHCMKASLIAASPLMESFLGIGTNMGNNLDSLSVSTVTASNCAFVKAILRLWNAFKYSAFQFLRPQNWSQLRSYDYSTILALKNGPRKMGFWPFFPFRRPLFFGDFRPGAIFRFLSHEIVPQTPYHWRRNYYIYSENIKSRKKKNRVIQQQVPTPHRKKNCNCNRNIRGFQGRAPPILTLQKNPSRNLML